MPKMLTLRDDANAANDEPAKRPMRKRVRLAGEKRMNRAQRDSVRTSNARYAKRKNDRKKSVALVVLRRKLAAKRKKRGCARRSVSEKNAVSAAKHAANENVNVPPKRLLLNLVQTTQW